MYYTYGAPKPPSSPIYGAPTYTELPKTTIPTCLRACCARTPVAAAAASAAEAAPPCTSPCCARQPGGVQKRRRLQWTDELHRKFLAALARIGPSVAVPKTLLVAMDTPGLTRENIASHLQKYRKSLRRKAVPSPGASDKADAESTGSGVVNAGVNRGGEKTVPNPCDVKVSDPPTDGHVSGENTAQISTANPPVDGPVGAARNESSATVTCLPTNKPSSGEHGMNKLVPNASDVTTVHPLANGPSGDAHGKENAVPIDTVGGNPGNVPANTHEAREEAVPTESDVSEVSPPEEPTVLHVTGKPQAQLRKTASGTDIAGAKSAAEARDTDAPVVAVAGQQTPSVAVEVKDKVETSTV